MIRLELLTTSNLDELDFSKCKEYEYFTLEERDKVKNIVHKSWLIKAINSSDNTVGVTWLSEEIVLAKEEHSISILIYDKFLRNGYGLLGLNKLTEMAFNDFDIIKLVAFIHRFNDKSRKLFEKANYIYLPPDESESFRFFDIYVKHK